MSKTIEAQLIALNNAREAHNRRNTDETFYEIIVAKAAIIADWNAALAAMKAFVDRELDADGCSYCDNGADSDHSPWCLVPQFQAAIKKMEGTK